MRKFFLGLAVALLASVAIYAQPAMKKVQLVMVQLVLLVMVKVNSNQSN